MQSVRILSLAILAVCTVWPAQALAAPTPQVSLREVASGFVGPLEIAHAGDGSGRLFVVEQGGRVRILKNGAVVATPFLDVSGLIAAVGEQGLLGLAFHPQFSANRRFFVCYTRASDGAIVVSEFLASAGNPDLADAGSERIVIVVPHPVQTNHNGGHIAFGPDGYLYIGTGDGGGAGDPDNNSQNSTSLLGKLLRIDVNTSPGYAIPASNPFVGQGGYAPEIWAYGLRNPWKFSFDRQNGDLYIGDVGQGGWEEINYQQGGGAGGSNYGWRIFEGVHCNYPPSLCVLPGHVPPVLEYAHDAQGGNSVTGGYVYRGNSIAELRGLYVYGDFISSRVWAAQYDGAWSTSVLIEPPSVLSNPSSFGEDEVGELYGASYGTGKIYAIEPAGVTHAPALATGYNLLGNTLSIALDATAIFGNQDTPVAGITSNIVSVWKWNIAQARWAFYSPLLTPAGIAAYAASRGHEVLATINAGEGYWVNSINSMTLPAQSGTPFNWNAITFANLPASFNLIAHHNPRTPSQFNNDMSLVPPSSGTVPTGNFLTLWAWDAVNAKWLYYSSLQESSGGIPIVCLYAVAHFYGCPDEIMLGPGVGFWVLRP